MSERIDLSYEIEYYREHPCGFIEDVLFLKPTEQQKMLIDAVKGGKKFISVKSGHGTGKSTICAAIILWFFCCYTCQIPITAPSRSQMWDALWSRLAELYNKMDPLFKESFDFLSDRVFAKAAKKEHFIVGRTAKKESPEALQGFHAKNLLFVVDEASGVSDEIYDVIMGALTEENNICILVGNPLRLSGYFYDCFHTKADQWHNITFNAEESPRWLVKQDFLDQWASYGKDSNQYRIRVLGQFPNSELDTLIPLDLIEQAQSRTVDASGSMVWACDPARYGSDSSVLVKRQGRVLHDVIEWNQFDTMEIAGLINHEYNKTPAEKRPDTIFIDTIGLGAGVYDRLNELDMPVKSVNVAEKSGKPKDFRNIRAQIYDDLRVWFAEDEPMIPQNKQLVAQLSTIKYKFASNGSLQIIEKDVYKKQNPSIGSPDMADALAISFYSKRDVPLEVLWI
jgi:hypothetical protein